MCRITEALINRYSIFDIPAGSWWQLCQRRDVPHHASRPSRSSIVQEVLKSSPSCCGPARGQLVACCAKQQDVAHHRDALSRCLRNNGRIMNVTRSSLSRQAAGGTLCQRRDVPHLRDPHLPGAVLCGRRQKQVDVAAAGRGCEGAARRCRCARRRRPPAGETPPPSWVVTKGEARAGLSRHGVPWGGGVSGADPCRIRPSAGCNHAGKGLILCLAILCCGPPSLHA